MCSLTLGLQAAGLAFSAFSSYNQAQGQKEAAEYQASVARNNAQIAEWQAQDAIRRGEDEETRQRMRTAQLKGTQRASMAANGIDISEGSAAQIQADTDWMGEQDALTIRDNAKRTAWGWRSQGAQSTADANMYKAKADSTSPWAAAAGSLLGNAGALANVGNAVADKWYSFKNSGNASSGIKLAGADPWSTY